MKNFFISCGIIFILLTGACTDASDPTISHKTEDESYPKSEVPIKEETLTKNKPVFGAIKGGESRLFNFEAAAGQYIHLVATQKEIDFKLVLIPPESDTSFVFDTPNGQRGSEDVYFISNKAGKYKIILSPLSDYAEPGGFDIILKTNREATQKDRTWIKLYEDMRAADRLRKKKETHQEAVAAFEKLIVQWDEMEDKNQEAVARRSLGYTLRSMGKKEEALSTFESVLPYWQELGEIRYEAFTYLILAGIHKTREEYDKALDLTFKAIDKWKEAGDLVQETRAYSDIASFYLMKGDYAKSKKYYNLGIAKAEESGSLSILGIMSREFGNAWQTFGDDEKVLELYKKALNIYEKMGHLPAQALVCRMSGDFLFNKGKMAESKPHFQRALEIYTELGDKKMRTSMENKLAGITAST